MDRWIDEACIVKNFYADGAVSRQIDRIDRWLDRQMDRWLDRQMDRQIDGQKDIWIERYMDREIDDYTDIFARYNKVQGKEHRYKKDKGSNNIP